MSTDQNQTPYKSDKTVLTALLRWTTHQNEHQITDNLITTFSQCLAFTISYQKCATLKLHLQITNYPMKNHKSSWYKYSVWIPYAYPVNCSKNLKSLEQTVYDELKLLYLIASSWTFESLVCPWSSETPGWTLGICSLHFQHPTMCKVESCEQASLP